MSNAQHAAATNARRWNAATEALNGVTPWLAFRWVVAQVYNAHSPQGAAQAASKARAAKLAARLVSALGGDIYAVTPASDLAGDKWSTFTQAAGMLEPMHQEAFLWTIWRGKWGVGTHQPSTAASAYTDMDGLRWALLDMRRQQEANSQGWIVGKGFPKIRAGRGSS